MLQPEAAGSMDVPKLPPECADHAAAGPGCYDYFIVAVVVGVLFFLGGVGWCSVSELWQQWSWQSGCW